jgi:phosphoribosylformylglycinamidine synthase
MRLCAQQQCVDPLQLTLSNVGVVARSQFGNKCTATTNIMRERFSSIEDMKASGNWTYTVQLLGEGAKIYSKDGKHGLEVPREWIEVLVH